MRNYRLFAAAAIAVLLCTEAVQAQSRRGGGGPTPQSMPSATVSPVKVGEPGIAWYSTWELARKEAIRSNRPIFFMAAASQCHGVPGAF